MENGRTGNPARRFLFEKVKREYSNSSPRFFARVSRLRVSISITLPRLPALYHPPAGHLCPVVYSRPPVRAPAFGMFCASWLVFDRPVRRLYTVHCNIQLSESGRLAGVSSSFLRACCPPARQTWHAACGASLSDLTTSYHSY